MSKTEPFDATLIDSLLDDAVQRTRRGEVVPIDEYCANHPDLADELRIMLPALVLLEKPVADLRLPESARSVPIRLADFEIICEIGRGAMGTVFEAIQTTLGRRVALKVFQTNGRSGVTHPDRFRREAHTAARLHHTNIIPVFEAGEADGVSFYAMQLIDGANLQQILNGQRRSTLSDEATKQERSADTAVSGNTSDIVKVRGFSANSVVNASPFRLQTADACASIALQIAEGLQFAHAQGILHRDIKPSNIMLDHEGRAWIADFGLAKPDESDDLSATGDVVGTLRYMAPERFQGKTDPRSDVYGLGLTLFEMLEGEPAYRQVDRARLVHQILNEPTPRLTSVRKDVGGDLQRIVAKSIARDPTDRYQRAGEMAEDLRRYLGRRPILARRLSVVEHGWRWICRNPVLSSLSAAVLVLTIGLTTALAIWFATSRARDEAVRQQLRAEIATAEATELRNRAEAAERDALVRAHLARAITLRQSGTVGQRFGALAEIGQAAHLGPSTELRSQLRDAAFAALRQADVRQIAKADYGTAIALQYDDDLKLLATGELDDPNPITVWDVVAHKPLVRLAGPSAGFWHFTATFSADGKYLAVTYSMREEPFEQLHVWDWKQAKLLYDLPVHCDNVVHSVSFHPNSRWLIAPLPDGDLTVLDMDDPSYERRIPFGYQLYAIRFGASGRRMVVGSHGPDQLVQVLDFETGRSLFTLTDLAGTYALNISANGKYLVTCDEYTRGFVWDIDQARQIATIEGHSDIIVSAEFLPDSLLLLTRSWDNTTRLWDAVTGQLLLNMPLHVLRTSRDGRRLGTTTAELELVCGDPVRTISCQRPDANEVYSSLGDFFLFGSSMELKGLFFTGGAQGLGIWDWARGNLLAHSEIGRCREILLHPQGHSLITSGEAGILYWPIEQSRPGDGQGTAVTIGPPQRLGDVTSLRHLFMCWLDDGRLALTDAQHSRVVLMDADPTDGLNQEPRFLSSTYNRFTSLSASPDGKWLATGGHKEDSIQVWNVDSGELITRLPPSDDENEVTVFQATFSPDGKSLVSTADNAIAPGFYIYDVPSWNLSRSLRSPWPPRTHPIFAPNSQWMAVPWKQNEILLTRCGDGAELARLQTTYPASVASVSADGCQLAVLGSKNSMEFWNLAKIGETLSELGLGWELSTPDPGRTLAPPIKVTLDPGNIEEELALAHQHRAVEEAYSNADRSSRAGRFVNAIAEYEKIIKVDPDHASTLNNLAWLLVTCPDRSLRDPARSLMLAEHAVKREPGVAIYLNTLGVAQYRNGQWRPSISSLIAAEQASPDQSFAHNYFFIAMAESRLGQLPAAIEHFANASRWMASRSPDDDELKQFQLEAAHTIFLFIRSFSTF